MPLDFTGLRETLLNQKKKQPVTPQIQAQPPAPPVATAPPEPRIESPGMFRTPDFNPSPFNPQPKMQEVGAIDAARAPRFDQIDPKLIGGGKLQSQEELTDLRSKGLVRPQNNFSFGDRLKSALKTALPGLVQGGIGGAIAGAVGGAVDPRQGRRYQFETFQQPSIDASNKRRQDQEAAQRAAAGQEAEATYKTAQAGRLDAQADLDRAKAEQETAQGPLTQKKLQAETKLAEARAEAARTGTAKRAEIAEDDGSVSLYDIFPDGTQTYLGKSGNAAIREADRKSREGQAEANRKNSLTIAGMHESGADRRQGRSEAAQDRRSALDRGRPNYNQLDTDAGKFEQLKTKALEKLNDPDATPVERDNAMREYQQQAARIEKNYRGKVRVNRDNPDWPGIEIISPDQQITPSQSARQTKQSANTQGKRTVGIKDVNAYIEQRAKAGEAIGWEEARRRFASQNIDIQ